VNGNLIVAVMMAGIAGPELDVRIAEYEAGTNTSKEDMLRDLKAATNLASMLALAGEAELKKQGLF
jgi:hypothetical protein